MDLITGVRCVDWSLKWQKYFLQLKFSSNISVTILFYAPKGWHIVIAPSVHPSRLTYFGKIRWNFIQLHNIIGFIKYLFPVGFWVNRSKVKVTVTLNMKIISWNFLEFWKKCANTENICFIILCFRGHLWLSNTDSCFQLLSR